MDPVLFFLAIAVFIIAVAFLLSKLFRRTIAKDKRHEDLNAKRSDGDATATWIGIDEGDHH